MQDFWNSFSLLQLNCVVYGWEHKTHWSYNSVWKMKKKNLNLIWHIGILGFCTLFCIFFFKGLAFLNLMKELELQKRISCFVPACPGFQSGMSLKELLTYMWFWCGEINWVCTVYSSLMFPIYHNSIIPKNMNKFKHREMLSPS